MSDTIEKEIVLDDNALKTITDSVAKNIGSTIESKIADAFKAQKEETMKELEKAEKNIEKNLGKLTDFNDVKPEVRLVKAAIALFRDDRDTLQKYNEYALDARTKAGYANETVNADGKYIIADPLFEVEIEKLAPQYGVALTDANVVPISQNSVKTNKRGSNVAMYETGEGVAKTGTKLTIEQVTVSLRKFAAIAIATDELLEDAAIDYWNEVTMGFAEEVARMADTLVFTDPNPNYPGILKKAGTVIESVGANITSVTWDDLINAESKVPTAARANMKHYMHRTVWAQIIQSKASTSGEYQWFPTMGNATPWGTPVVLCDILPDIYDTGDGNEGFIVTGDLKRIKLYRKRGLVLDVSNHATVTDANSGTVNLFAQDMTALRAVVRMVALCKFPEAFVITGTGTVS